jgi:hypothetical protein
MTQDADSAAQLAAGVRRRWTRPGPPGRPRPPALGSVGAAAARFAAGTSRAPAIRRLLAVTGDVTPRPVGSSDVAPPRWWTPRRVPPPVPETLPARTLPRAVRRVPVQDGYEPGAMAGRMAPDVVRVRRHAEVTGAGPMLMQRDTQPLRPPPPRDAEPTAGGAAGARAEARDAPPPAGGGRPAPTGAAAPRAAGSPGGQAQPATFGSPGPAGGAAEWSPGAVYRGGATTVARAAVAVARGARAQASAAPGTHQGTTQDAGVRRNVPGTAQERRRAALVVPALARAAGRVAPAAVRVPAHAITPTAVPRSSAGQRAARAPALLRRAETRAPLRATPRPLAPARGGDSARTTSPPGAGTVYAAQQRAAEVTSLRGLAPAARPAPPAPAARRRSPRDPASVHRSWRAAAQSSPRVRRAGPAAYAATARASERRAPHVLARSLARLTSPAPLARAAAAERATIEVATRRQMAGALPPVPALRRGQPTGAAEGGGMPERSRPDVARRSAVSSSPSGTAAARSSPESAPLATGRASEAVGRATSSAPTSDSAQANSAQSGRSPAARVTRSTGTPGASPTETSGRAGAPRPPSPDAAGAADPVPPAQPGAAASARAMSREPTSQPTTAGGAGANPVRHSTSGLIPGRAAMRSAARQPGTTTSGTPTRRASALAGQPLASPGALSATGHSTPVGAGSLLGARGAAVPLPGAARSVLRVLAGPAAAKVARISPRQPVGVPRTTASGLGPARATPAAGAVRHTATGLASEAAAMRSAAPRPGTTTTPGTPTRRTSALAGQLPAWPDALSAAGHSTPVGAGSLLGARGAAVPLPGAARPVLRVLAGPAAARVARISPRQPVGVPRATTAYGPVAARQMAAADGVSPGAGRQAARAPSCVSPTSAPRLNTTASPQAATTLVGRPSPLLSSGEPADVRRSLERRAPGVRRAGQALPPGSSAVRSFRRGDPQDHQTAYALARGSAGALDRALGADVAVSPVPLPRGASAAPSVALRRAPDGGATARRTTVPPPVAQAASTAAAAAAGTVSHTERAPEAAPFAAAPAMAIRPLPSRATATAALARTTTSPQDVATAVSPVHTATGRTSTTSSPRHRPTGRRRLHTLDPAGRAVMASRLPVAPPRAAGQGPARPGAAAAREPDAAREQVSELVRRSMQTTGTGAATRGAVTRSDESVTNRPEALRRATTDRKVPSMETGAANGAAAAVVRRYRSGPSASASELPADALDHDDLALDARQFDELVDRVVTRIEDRVVEELERRGRRNLPGVF